MSKFRKKPIVIEAFKLGDRPYPEWFDQAFEEEIVGWKADIGGTRLAIQTLEGEVDAYKGRHYIIKGIKEEIYPCRVDIFESSYEPVED